MKTFDKVVLLISIVAIFFASLSWIEARNCRERIRILEMAFVGAEERLNSKTQHLTLDLRSTDEALSRMFLRLGVVEQEAAHTGPNRSRIVELEKKVFPERYETLELTHSDD